MRREFIMPRLCVSSLLWRTRPVGDVSRAMMRVGLDKLELAAAPLAPEHYQPAGNNSALFNILAEAGIHVIALRLTGMDYAQKCAAIADAGARGIPLVVDRAERLNFPDMVDRLRVYAMCAAQAGVQFVIENDAHGACDNAEAQVALGKIIQHPALTFAIAPPHTLADGRDPAAEIQILGPRLRVAYLSDASADVARESVIRGFPDHLFEENAAPRELSAGGPDEQLPGNRNGTVNWTGYFQALAESAFRGVFTLAWTGGDDWPDDRTDRAVSGSIARCLEAAERADF